MPGAGHRGILGARRGLDRGRISDACRGFAQRFEGRFGSLRCGDLRPQGLAPGNPPHLCEALSRDAIGFAARSVSEVFPQEEREHD